MNDPFDLDEPAGPQTSAAYPPPPSVRLAAAPPRDLQHAGFSCAGCGYDLTGAMIGGACPECGSHINPQHLSSAPLNGMAITSMIMGILTFVITPIIFAPLGIIFGHIARKQIRSGRYAPGSSGFALTGLICSYIGLGLTLLVVLIIVLLIML